MVDKPLHNWLTNDYMSNESYSWNVRRDRNFTYARFGFCPEKDPRLESKEWSNTRRVVTCYYIRKIVGAVVLLNMGRTGSSTNRWEWKWDTVLLHNGNSLEAPMFVKTYREATAELSRLWENVR